MSWRGALERASASRAWAVCSLATRWSTCLRAAATAARVTSAAVARWSNSAWGIVCDASSSVARCLCCCAKRSLASRDRKSTRNSSHGYISYAVFCLKKKKSNILDHRVKQNKTNKYYEDSDDGAIT